MELTNLLDLFGLKINGMIKLKKSSKKLTKFVDTNRPNSQILKEIIYRLLEFKIFLINLKKVKNFNSSDKHILQGILGVLEFQVLINLAKIIKPNKQIMANVDIEVILMITENMKNNKNYL